MKWASDKVLKYLNASYKYYCNDEETGMSDCEYDTLCRELLEQWDSLNYVDKAFLDKAMLAAGTGYAISPEVYAVVLGQVELANVHVSIRIAGLSTTEQNHVLKAEEHLKKAGFLIEGKPGLKAFRVWDINPSDKVRSTIPSICYSGRNVQLNLVEMDRLYGIIKKGGA